MDYEKAYKAVLNTAKQWIKDGCTDKERICLECVFPELREGEDERIRKILIRIVKGACNKYGIKYKGDEITEEKLLDYLEKQKENPKSADSIPADCVSDVKCEDRSPKHSDSFGTDIRDTPAYWRGWDDAMEQKEQKPVEWNKKPCLTCQEYKKGFEAGRLEGVTAGYNKAVKEKEQKPAEWSEEDEDNLKAIIRIIEDNDSDWKELTDWLNSLHDNYKKCNSRWKPSEEQIYSLGTVVKGYNECTVGSVGYHLKELYEQLKKLK